MVSFSATLFGSQTSTLQDLRVQLHTFGSSHPVLIISLVTTCLVQVAFAGPKLLADDLIYGLSRQMGRRGGWFGGFEEMIFNHPEDHQHRDHQPPGGSNHQHRVDDPTHGSMALHPHLLRNTSFSSETDCHEM